MAVIVLVWTAVATVIWTAGLLVLDVVFEPLTEAPAVLPVLWWLSWPTVAVLGSVWTVRRRHRRLRGHRREREVYRAATYPSDTGQAEGFFGWMPTVVVAPIIGAVAAFVSGDAWLFLIVTVAGVALGIAASFLLWYLFYQVDERWLRLGPVSISIAFFVFAGTGPVVTLLIAGLLLFQ